MKVSEAVAKRIDHYLFERNITLYRLAKDSCLPISTLQNLYSGHTKSPTLTVVLKLSQALGVSAGEFLNFPLFYDENLELD